MCTHNREGGLDSLLSALLLVKTGMPVFPEPFPQTILIYAPLPINSQAFLCLSEVTELLQRSPSQLLCPHPSLRSPYSKSSQHSKTHPSTSLSPFSSCTRRPDVLSFTHSTTFLRGSDFVVRNRLWTRVLGLSKLIGAKREFQARLLLGHMLEHRGDSTKERVLQADSANKGRGKLLFV